MVVVEGECGGAWGTWEELILAGAVLRHGTQAWDAVASEVRARTRYPFSFTPEVCEVRHKVLQQHYFGCKALFEDLKKRRIKELRREIEKSDDSIGSLETKLEKLKAQSHSQIDSTTPVMKSEGVDSFGKDSSKDGLSAGSFTQDVSKITETDSKPEISAISDEEKDLSFKRKAQKSNDKEGIFKRKRGRRNRKDCNGESKEGSNGDSENMGSGNVTTSTMRSTDLKNLKVASLGHGNDYLMGIFNSIAENDVAMVFRRKLDSQKRARYRKIIMRHLDFDTLRSRISNCAISSVKQLFRDLLLISNNALVFYSKRTREYKSALLLRDIVTESYKKHCRAPSIRALSSFFPLPNLRYLPVKPRSARPHKNQVDTDNSENGALNNICVTENREVSKNESNVCVKPSNESLMVEKRIGKAGRGSVTKAMKNDKKKLRRR